MTVRRAFHGFHRRSPHLSPLQYGSHTLRYRLRDISTPVRLMTTTATKRSPAAATRLSSVISAVLAKVRLAPTEQEGRANYDCHLSPRLD